MRDRSNLVVVANETALALELARFVSGRAVETIARRGRFDIALAGGSTPKAAYTLLAQAPFANAVSWERVRFFFGDERCVPPDDDQSNYKMAKNAMLDALRIAPAAVHRMHGEDPPQAAARAYAQMLRHELPLGADGVPAFDLVMLGMGPDGHTASLFPGSDPFDGDASLVKAPYVEKFATHRITLTPCVIHAADEVVVATAGGAKTEALAAVLDGPLDARTYPIQILRSRARPTKWLLDRAAAALLATS